VAKKLQRNDGLLQHHWIPRPDSLGLPFQPFICKTLRVNHILNNNQSKPISFYFGFS